MTTSIRIATGALLVLVSSCADDTASSGQRSSPSAEGIKLEVVRSVLVATEPLGDVGTGHLAPGHHVTGLCFVDRAQGNAGAWGSAVKVVSGDLEGFAATSTFPAEKSLRQRIFHVDTSEQGTARSLQLIQFR